MKCGKCGGKGYLEEFYHYGANARPMIKQCCDIAAYSRRVQAMIQGPEEAFKAYGRENPIIARHMNVTKDGIELKRGPTNPREGEPCPVIPFPKR